MNRSELLLEFNRANNNEALGLPHHLQGPAVAYVPRLAMACYRAAALPLLRRGNSKVFGLQVHGKNRGEFLDGIRIDKMSSVKFEPAKYRDEYHEAAGARFFRRSLVTFYAH